VGNGSPFCYLSIHLPFCYFISLFNVEICYIESRVAQKLICPVRSKEEDLRRASTGFFEEEGGGKLRTEKRCHQKRMTYVGI